MFIDLGGNKKQLLSNGDNKKTVEKEAKEKIMKMTNNNMKTLLKKATKEEINTDQIVREENKKGDIIKIGGKIGLIVDSYKTIINEDNSNPIIFTEKSLACNNIITFFYGFYKFWDFLRWVL